jgi:hypothetical protein
MDAKTAMTVIYAILIADVKLIDHGAALGSPHVHFGKSGSRVILKKPVADNPPIARGKLMLRQLYLGKKGYSRAQYQQEKKKTFHKPLLA